jgi:hypothetical protein
VRKSNIPFITHLTEWISLAISLLSIVIYTLTGRRFMHVVSIVFLLIFYHFSVRLAVGDLFNLFKPDLNAENFWFRHHSFEAKILSSLKVRKWKDHIPTFQPQSFNIYSNSIDSIIYESCKAELIHEVNVLMSLLSVIFIIPAGNWQVSFPLIMIFAVLGCFFDLQFVLVQRYNRPRYLSLKSRWAH